MSRSEKYTLFDRCFAAKRRSFIGSVGVVGVGSVCGAVLHCLHVYVCMSVCVCVTLKKRITTNYDRRRFADAPHSLHPPSSYQIPPFQPLLAPFFPSSSRRQR